MERLDLIIENLNNVIKTIEEEKKYIDSDIESYKMRYKKSLEKIQHMQEELENYRPTKLTGSGLCSCDQCTKENGFNLNWICWSYSFKGHIYCGNCLKKLFPDDYKNAVQQKY